MTVALKAYFPQVLEWFRDKEAAVFADFLERWPTLQAAQRARRETLESCFRNANVRRTATIDRRLDAIRQERVLHNDEAVITPARLATGAATTNDTAMEPTAPARLEPERYKVQFTASEEYVKLVDEAKALLSHSDRRLGLDELHLRAMRALVAELQHKKRAAAAKPRRPAERSTEAPAELIECAKDSSDHQRWAVSAADGLPPTSVMSSLPDAGEAQ